jgi:16S rRNA (cytosine967-C5)-methyltransferase
MNTVAYRNIVVQGLGSMLDSMSLPQQFSSWPSSSKALLLESCRYFPKLNAVIQHLCPKPIKHSFIYAAILVGLCELMVFTKPPHAVINELVNIIKTSRHRYAAGFVNATLRRFTREAELIQTHLQSKPEYHYAHPEWFIHQIQVLWPDDWQDILTANNQQGPMTLRVNLNKISREDFIKNAKLDAKIGSCSPASVILNLAQPVNEIYGFEQGLVSVQDEAAQLAMSLLDLKPGFKVLDACAAPGGKTAHMLESYPLACTAIEPQNHRFEKLKATLMRLNLSAKCILADATDPTSWWDGHKFDRILLDAPCSGSGVIRRHPDFKLRQDPTQLFTNLPIQAKLLQTLWQLLAPGGLLLYATCSILVEENDHQIHSFIQQHPDATYQIPTTHFGKSTLYGQQILPGHLGMDGFYYALLKKSCMG